MARGDSAHPRMTEIETDPDDKPSGPRRAATLLREFEEFLGRPLVQLDTPDVITIEGDQVVKWSWSWDPPTCATFMAEWDSSIFVMHPNLRDLALTKAPGKRQLMYELACTKDVRERIDGILATVEAAESNAPPLKKGPCSIDLRPAPPFHKPEVFTIGPYHFYGMIKGISQDLYDQLAEMHGRWYAEGVRMVMPIDHAEVDLGQVRA